MQCTNYVVNTGDGISEGNTIEQDVNMRTLVIIMMRLMLTLLPVTDVCNVQSMQTDFEQMKNFEQVENLDENQTGN